MPSTPWVCRLLQQLVRLECADDCDYSQHGNLLVESCFEGGWLHVCVCMCMCVCGHLSVGFTLCLLGGEGNHGNDVSYAATGGDEGNGDGGSNGGSMVSVESGSDGVLST